jgi:molybdenum cofactor cytidylyltransferase
MPKATPPRLVGILLAAGAAARYGGDKLLAPLPRSSYGVPASTPIGAAAAAHLVSALPESIAVVRPQDRALASLLCGVPIGVVRCARAHEGMGASLACGVGSASDADGWVVALADMPWVAPSTIRAVRDAIAGGASIAAPAYRGRRGHPVGFSRTHRHALASLAGDTGARALLERHRERIALIDVDDACVLRDVDTPDDLQP